MLRPHPVLGVPPTRRWSRPHHRGERSGIERKQRGKPQAFFHRTRDWIFKMVHGLSRDAWKLCTTTRSRVDRTHQQRGGTTIRQHESCSKARDTSWLIVPSFQAKSTMRFERSVLAAVLIWSGATSWRGRGGVHANVGGGNNNPSTHYYGSGGSSYSSVGYGQQQQQPQTGNWQQDQQQGGSWESRSSSSNPLSQQQPQQQQQQQPDSAAWG